MNNVINIADQQALDLEASLWVTKLDGKRLSAEEFGDFRAWLQLSANHLAAFKQAAMAWGDLEILTGLAGAVPAPKRRGWSHWLGAGKIRTTRTRPILALATAFMLLIVGLSVNWPGSLPTTGGVAIYTTVIGESKTVELADGSTLLLNTASQVEVQYSPNRRTLKLLRGEVHFKVAHDSARPFEVHAGTNIVRAVGTAFTVELKAETVEVTVTEGRVELASVAVADSDISAPHETSLALVSSGQSAQFSDYVQSIVTIGQDEVDRRLAWHKGALIFKGEALEDVISEVSRYTKTKIVISDPEIRSLKIGGYFKTGETEAMLQALETSFGISARKVGKDLVYLSQSLPN